MKEERGTTTPGFVNRNRQFVVKRTTLEGNLAGQKMYALRCGHCGHEYGANGCDIHIRRCPRCQKGQPGLEIR